MSCEAAGATKVSTGLWNNLCLTDRLPGGAGAAALTLKMRESTGEAEQLQRHQRRDTTVYS